VIESIEYVGRMRGAVECPGEEGSAGEGKAPNMDVEVAVHQPTLNNATRHDPSENLDLGLLQIIMRAG
jgi:hypothetical protein